MKKFKGNYERIIENTITRFEMGGLLSGDLVRFRKDAMKNDNVKSMMDSYKAQIENAINTDLNLRVSAIKSIRPNSTGNYAGGSFSGTDAPANFFVDIVVEYAPGLWKDPITVPMEVLERVDTGINLAPVPDSVKRKSDVEMPKEVNSPDADRKTPTKNTPPQFPTNVTDGKSQVKKAKEVKKKNQGKLTLENVYEAMIAPDTNQPPIAYRVTFGEPYGDQQDELLKRIQSMPGLDNNMDSEFPDSKTLILKLKNEIDPKTLENMITNVVRGSVTVSKDDQLTSFGEPDINDSPQGHETVTSFDDDSVVPNPR